MKDFDGHLKRRMVGHCESALALGPLSRASTSNFNKTDRLGDISQP